jgi:hypothetical protein
VVGPTRREDIATKVFGEAIKTISPKEPGIRLIVIQDLLNAGILLCPLGSIEFLTPFLKEPVDFWIGIVTEVPHRASLPEVFRRVRICSRPPPAEVGLKPVVLSEVLQNCRFDGPHIKANTDLVKVLFQERADGNPQWLLVDDDRKLKGNTPAINFFVTDAVVVSINPACFIK